MRLLKYVVNVPYKESWILCSKWSFMLISDWKIAIRSNAKGNWLFRCAGLDSEEEPFSIK